ncbi:MAG: alpha/beta fold hydrolase [Acidobacteriota bacterium]|nr:alpha/beta fold hydrolase [Acidobacteriota bacterium]
MRNVPAILLAILLAVTASAQAPDPPATARALTSHDRGTDRAFEEVVKNADDILWYFKVGDVASIDKIQYTSKPERTTNPTGQGAGNPMILPAYVFAPKNLRGKAPLIVFIHGGVHSDFNTFYAHIVRELIDQGYVIIAPEYRGSTGYGGDFYDQIDYGGLELDDVKAARDWAVENLSSIDPKRIGIMGWSHGGYQTLMNIFKWPDAYQAAYAGVPVSDLVQRMGYKSQGYRDTFKGFIGKEAADNPMEYRLRSPYFHAAELKIPLLIHTNTNDEDVHVMEVEHLIDALKAAGKKFEYKIYQAAPGGHEFNRIDTSIAKESRKEIYEFLARYLK